MSVTPLSQPGFAAACCPLAQAHDDVILQLTHLETDFAVKSRSKVPILQLSRGATASHFCHWARPFIPHVGAYRQARSPSYNDSYGGLEPALAPRAFPKGTLHLNGEPIASPGGPLGKAGREIPQGTTAGNSTKLGLFAPA